MQLISPVCGSIPDVLKNVDGLYEGNLKHYFRVLVTKARNLLNPYHNLRHMLHTTWLCYDACAYYRHELTPRQMRNLLIAAMVHDLNHHGRQGDDDLNIEAAIRALKAHSTAADYPHIEDISDIVRVTEFPHSIPSDKLSLSGLIIRDADLSQTFSAIWIQQVVIGFAAEWNRSPLDILRMQPSFLSNIKFLTGWAQEKFPRTDIDAKIKEAIELTEILEESDENA